jgi:hypothetical protein
MRIIDRDGPITVGELSEMAEHMYGGLVKAVVDVKRGLMAVDAELHADEEKELLEIDSKQADLWGINLYPELFETDDFVEFDSVINMRPMHGNRSRSVDDEQLRDEIIRTVSGMVRA